MAIKDFKGFATTRHVQPGQQEMLSDGRLAIREQVFTDVMESHVPAIVGETRPVLDLLFNPQPGSGSVGGRMLLTVTGGGTWVGELYGAMEAGKVSASAIARGTGPFDGQVLRVDWQQVDAHPGAAPCAGRCEDV